MLIGAKQFTIAVRLRDNDAETNWPTMQRTVIEHARILHHEAVALDPSCAVAVYADDFFEGPKELADMERTKT